MKILFSDKFEKQFYKLPTATQESILRKLHSFEKEDDNLDIKKINPKNLGFFRLRIGSFRIIFEYSNSTTATLLMVDSRAKIYFKL